MVGTEVSQLQAGHDRRPMADAIEYPVDVDLQKAVLNDEPIWEVKTTYRTGLEDEKSMVELFATESDALNFEAKYPIGAEIDIFDFLEPESKGFDPENLSLATELSIFGRGEPPYFLIYEALEGAGVYDEKWHLSKDVLAWLGNKGMRALRGRFGDNWDVVAALEFCSKNFHSTSLATLAARALCAEYVADSDYDAGYASRELELLVIGAEEVAIKALRARELAGKGGGKSAQKRRLKNLEILMGEIEKLSGAVGLFSESRIVAQAIDSARDLEPKMPKSKSTLDGYGTALRSEEPFKSRYEAVFRKNA